MQEAMYPMGSISSRVRSPSRSSSRGQATSRVWSSKRFRGFRCIRLRFRYSRLIAMNNQKQERLLSRSSRRSKGLNGAPKLRGL